jgi:hypothetical protein
MIAVHTAVLTGTPVKQQERSDLLFRQTERSARAYSIGIPIDIAAYHDHRRDADATTSQTPYRDQRLVIARRDTLAERGDTLPNPIDAGGGAAFIAFEKQLIEAFNAEEISALAGFGGCHRFGDSVGIEEQQIAAFHLESAFPVILFVENAQRQTAFDLDRYNAMASDEPR